MMVTSVPLGSGRVTAIMTSVGVATVAFRVCASIPPCRNHETLKQPYRKDRGSVVYS